MAEHTAAKSITASRGRDAERAVTSAVQDGLWFRSALVPETSAWNLCRAFRVSGRFGAEALGAAWRTVLRRHDTLRTTLVDDGGRPVQRIAAWSPDEPDGMSVVDLRTMPEADREAHAERLCAELAAAPFQPAGEPLARLVLLRLHATECVLLLVLHRAVADERSMAVVVDELSAGYAAEAAGRPAPSALPVLPSRFADHAREQRAWQETADFRRLRDWWVSHLTPLPPALALPTDRPRAARPSLDGGAERFAWDHRLSEPLARFARSEGVAPSAVLLTAFQALLHRYGGQDRITVAVPGTVRPGPEADRLVGPFTDLLPLCADFSANPAFRDAVAQVARTVRAAHDHRGLPFARLVQALRVEREAHRVPLCDAVFACRDDEAPEPVLRLTGTAVRTLPVHNGAALADLVLTVETTGPALTGTLEYRRGLFRPDSVRRVLDQLRTLLDAALCEPGLAVDALPLDGPDRIRAGVRESDRIAHGRYGGLPADALTRRHAEESPDAAAVVWRGEEVSYRDLTERAGAIADRLRRLGAVGGAPVAVRMPPGPDLYAALLGVFEAGASLVWLGTGETGERGRVVLADARPACLVLAGGPDGDGLARWYRDELRGRILDATALVPAGAARRAGAPPAARRAPGTEGQRAYLAYTSGSTGKPKGIAQTHGALAQFTTWLAEEFGIGPGGRVAQWVTPEHDPALCEVFAALVSGATLCPVPERVRTHPDRFVDWLVEERISHLQTVPSFARELLRTMAARDRSGLPGSLECVLLMGEALPDELANGLRSVLPGTRLVNLYGPTETIAATWYEVTGTVHGTAPVGRPIPGRQVLVLDELGRPCPDGVTGEIVVRSPYVAQGYLSAGYGDDRAFAPLPDRELFPAGRIGCYRTGDLGVRRRDGHLEFRGRKDFQVKLYGNRLELTEVESALATHESVAECAAAARSGRDGLASGLVVYVVPRRTPSGAVLGSKEEWRARLRARFGRLALPVSFVVLDGRLPRNAAGKVDRRRLPAPGPPSASVPTAPRTATERRMAELWEELLDTESVGVQDSFFALGGHSLLLLRLVRGITERFGVRLPLDACLAHPTPAGLAHLVDAATPVTRAVTEKRWSEGH